MPTSGWVRFTLFLFVGLSFLASLLGVSVGHAAKYATAGTVITGVTLILLVIERWAWHWPIVRNVLKVPNLKGTWRVELESSYDGVGGGKQTIYLVIHQTYSTVVVEVLTTRIRSCSDTASLARRGPRFLLAYVYRGEPEAIRREGNEPHRGAAELLIETGKKLRFEGDYWTDRKHVGRLRASGWNEAKCGSFATASEASFEPR